MLGQFRPGRGSLGFRFSVVGAFRAPPSRQALRHTVAPRFNAKGLRSIPPTSDWLHKGSGMTQAAEQARVSRQTVARYDVIQTHSRMCPWVLCAAKGAKEGEGVP